MTAGLPLSSHLHVKVRGRTFSWNSRRGFSLGGFVGAVSAAGGFGVGAIAIVSSRGSTLDSVFGEGLRQKGAPEYPCGVRIPGSMRAGIRGADSKS